MKVEYICHACLSIETDDARIVTDPWFAEPAYCEKWYVFPKPVRTDFVNDTDVILISHGHEDHLNEATLKLFPKDAKVFYPYSFFGGAKEYIESLGFSDVKEAVTFKKYTISEKTSVTFIINSHDSLMVIESGGKVLVNANDALHSYGLQSYEGLRTFEPKKTSESFARGGYFVMRDGWEKSDNYLLIDCGELGAINGAHSHADALAIDLAVGGKTVLADAGTYTYHESSELRDFFRTTIGHNTLMIDGKSQSEPGGKFSWKTRSAARAESWISEDRFDFFEGSHDGYERLESPAVHTRSVLFLKNDYWIIRDFVKTDGSHDYGLNYHFNIKTNPAIESAEGGTLCISESAAGLRLFTFGDNGNWQRKESWISTCYGKRVNAPFLRFISKGAGMQEFFTFLLPTDNGFETPEVFETELSGGRAFVIKYRDYNDLFVLTDGEQIVRTEFFNTNFQFLWARLSAGEDLPEEFVLINGTNFSLGGRDVINFPNRLKFASARRLGNRLNVRTSESVFSVSLPQKHSSVFVLKNSEQS